MFTKQRLVMTGKKYRTSCWATLRSFRSTLLRHVSTSPCCLVGGVDVRGYARLGVAADGEEEGIDGGEIAEGVEDDEGEQRTGRNVHVCPGVSSCLLLALGGHSTMVSDETEADRELQVGAESSEQCVWQSQYSHFTHGHRSVGCAVRVASDVANRQVDTVLGNASRCLRLGRSWHQFPSH
jgi:hypothetical protein